MTALSSVDKDLLNACDNKDAKAAKAAIASGANVNACEDAPALHIAISKKSKSLVKLLLSNGVAVNTFDDEGYTPLHLLAISLRDVAIGQAVVEAGADVNATDKVEYQGNTPLHEAVKFGKLDFAEFLVGAGANVDKPSTDDNYTPLMMLLKSESGVLSSREEANAKWLLDKGADVSIRSDFDATPLHYAVKSGSLAMVNELVDRGATIELDKHGNQPLHYDCSTWSKDTALWDRLIELGCDDIDRALENCQSGHNLFGVKFFLEKGGDPNYVRDGKSVLESARELNQDKIVKVLEKAGAK